MTQHERFDPGAAQPIAVSDYIRRNAEELSAALNRHMKNTFKPDARKSLRTFSMAEAAYFVGTSPSNIRKLHGQGKIAEAPEDKRGRKLYTAEHIHEIRRVLAETGRNAAMFRPGRQSPDDHLAVLAVANFKGGSGKSTSAIHLAHALAMRGYRTLCLDLDPQASLTTTFGYRPEIEFSDRGTLYDVLTYDSPAPMRDVIRKTYFPNLDLAPGGIMLSEYETETPIALRDRASGPVFYNRLSAALAEVDAEYDVVIIDCPPQIGFLTLTALSAATGVLTTIVPSMYDVASMAQFLMLSANLIQSIESAGASPNWQFMKYLISRYEPNDGPQQQMAAFLRMILGDSVLDAEFLKSVAIGDASSTQQTIYEVDPADLNRRTLERAMASVRAVATEVEVLLQQGWGRDPATMLKGYL